MNENRIYCGHPAKNYCKLSLQSSCLQFNNCPCALSGIEVTFSLGNFQGDQPVTERQSSLTMEDILFQGVGI